MKTKGFHSRKKIIITLLNRYGCTFIWGLVWMAISLFTQSAPPRSSVLAPPAKSVMEQGENHSSFLNGRGGLTPTEAEKILQKVININEVGILVHATSGSQHIFRSIWERGLLPGTRLGIQSSRVSRFIDYVSFSMVGKGGLALTYAAVSLWEVGGFMGDSIGFIVNPRYVEENKGNFKAVGTLFHNPNETLHLSPLLEDEKAPYGLEKVITNDSPVQDEVLGIVPTDSEKGIPFIGIVVHHNRQEIFKLIKTWMGKLTYDDKTKQVPIYSIFGDLLWPIDVPNQTIINNLKLKKSRNQPAQIEVNL